MEVQDGQPLEIVLTDDSGGEILVLGRVEDQRWRAALDAQQVLVLRPR